jgi:ribosomal protein S18 acetylase RimI-like enzyme
MVEIRPATPDDVPDLGRILAAAFADDPVWQWLASPRADWTRRATAWFEAEARSQLAGHGEVLVDSDGRGCAIWAPPGHWKSTPSEGLALAVPSVRLFGRNLLTSVRMLSAMEKLHPPEPPHWYLAIIGTDPRHQGSGVGSALIRTITDRCDEEATACYLESSKERNVPFYARHGFAVRDEVRRRGAPPMWTMWRDPR